MNGSGHLVHGMGQQLETPVWPAITDADAARVVQHFPDVGGFHALHWHSPRPFSAAALVECGAGLLFLKRHQPRLRSIAALNEEHGFIRHLQTHGLSVPPMYRCHGRETVLADGPWVYELHGQGQGADLYRDRLSWTGFLNDRHSFAAGAALAGLHRAAAGYDAPDRGPYPLVASAYILTAADPLLAADHYIHARPAVAAYLQRWASSAQRSWREALAEIWTKLGGGLYPAIAQQPRLWTHGDWHPSNLLWAADDSVSTVLDFGVAAPSFALHDLAMALERSVIPWLSMDGGQLTEAAHVDAAVALLAGYHSVQPLSTADIALVLRLLPLVHVEFALSEVDYFAGIVRDDAAADLAWDGYALGHAHWFLSSQGQHFLHSLAKGTSAI